MWSIGCVLLELIYKKALFNGKDEEDCLDKIFVLTGRPSDLDPCYDAFRDNFFRTWAPTYSSRPGC